MRTLKINNKKYRIDLALTEQERQRGLSHSFNIPDDYGMLFVFKEPQEVSMTMEATYLNLDIIFIDEEGKVISCKKGMAFSATPITEKNVKYVLEVRPNSNISKGDIIDISDIPNSMEENVMHILDENGEPQFELESGERIVSRRETKILIRKAHKANKSKSDTDYASLARYLFKVFNNQDSREPEYVSKK